MKVIKKITEDDMKALEDRYYTYRKGKKEGKHVGWRASLDESPYVLKWFESQTNKADALRYLIEENILANGGIVDLAEVLPRVRNFEDKFKKKLARKSGGKIKQAAGVVDNVYDEVDPPPYDWTGDQEEGIEEANEEVVEEMEEVKGIEILETVPETPLSDKKSNEKNVVAEPEKADNIPEEPQKKRKSSMEKFGNFKV